MDIPLLTIYSGVVPQKGQSGDVFAPASDTWLSYQNVVFPEINVSIGEMNTTFAATDILAQSTADIASNISTTADYRGGWSNLTGAFDIGASVSHNGLKWQSTIAIADVTLSEPSLGNAEWFLSAQNSSRATVSTPFTLITPGRYLIVGSGIITIPNPSTLTNGQTFNFKRIVGELPVVQVGVAVDVFKFDGKPDDDGIRLDSVLEIDITVYNGFYEV